MPGRSRHRVRILSMTGAFWKWRMRSGALELAEQVARLARDRRTPRPSARHQHGQPARVSGTGAPGDRGDAGRALHARKPAHLPAAARPKRDLTYGMIQHLSMLAADRVCFNSAYHLESWFDELPRLLKHFPDYTHLETAETARAKSSVLPVGCDLARFDRYRDNPEDKGTRGETPLILWNQRWEYDKDPGDDAAGAVCAGG